MDLLLAPRAVARLKLNLNPGIRIPTGTFVSSSVTFEKFRLLAPAVNYGAVPGDILVRAESITALPARALAGQIDTPGAVYAGWNSVTNPLAPVQPGDLDLSSGDLQITSGAVEISQNLRIRWKFFLGEWFLNPAIGIPYFQQILVKNPNLDVVRYIFKKAAEDIPKVASVTRLDLNLERATREMTAVIEVTTDLGEQLAFTETLIFENLG